MNVQLEPPTVGSRYAPVPLTGPATLELREDGLHVTAAKVSNRYLSHVILASVLLIGLGTPLIIDIFGWKTSAGFVLVEVAVAWLLLKGMRGGARAGEKTTQLFPWPNVRDVVNDPHTGCMIVVIKGMKPSGGLYLREPGGDIEARLRHHIDAQRSRG